jgi:hypothetical protein
VDERDVNGCVQRRLAWPSFLDEYKTKKPAEKRAFYCCADAGISTETESPYLIFASL